MAEPVITEDAATLLLEHILMRLRERGFVELASEISESAATRVVDEIDAKDLEHLPRSIRSELGRKSVRSRSAVEQLSVALDVLDGRLREAPAVSTAAAALLNVAPAAIRFEIDTTAVEMPNLRSEGRFSLAELVYEPAEEEQAVSALRTLWGAIGREVAPIRKAGSWPR